MAITGTPDGGPMRFPTPIADMTCGLFTLIGILAALEARHTTGLGQMLDMSLQEGQMTWLENYAGTYFATGEEPQQFGNRHPQIAPYEPVQAKDGKMPQVRAVMQQRTADDWLELLRVADVPVGKINSVSEALADPHLTARNFIVELEHPLLGMVRSLATPVTMSRTALRYDLHPPTLGEHTEEILAELGYSDAQIQTLRQEGVT
jgi:crotonobetainyl-CoA:carnitine CoA-transferase CaiB-like acyl-CoA transferase